MTDDRLSDSRRLEIRPPKALREAVLDAYPVEQYPSIDSEQKAWIRAAEDRVDAARRSVETSVFRPGTKALADCATPVALALLECSLRDAETDRAEALAQLVARADADTNDVIAALEEMQGD